MNGNDEITCVIIFVSGTTAQQPPSFRTMNRKIHQIVNESMQTHRILHNHTHIPRRRFIRRAFASTPSDPAIGMYIPIQSRSAVGLPALTCGQVFSTARKSRQNPLNQVIFVFVPHSNHPHILSAQFARHNRGERGIAHVRLPSHFRFNPTPLFSRVKSAAKL